MDCLEISRGDLLELYVADKLEPRSQDLLETHLLQCKACSCELEARLIIRSELAASENTIRTANARPAFFTPIKLLVFALLLLVVLGGTFVGYRSSKFGKPSPIPSANSIPPPGASPSTEHPAGSEVGGQGSLSDPLNPTALNHGDENPQQTRARAPLDRTSAEATRTTQPFPDENKGEQPQVAQNGVPAPLTPQADPGPLVTGSRAHESTLVAQNGLTPSLTSDQAVEIYKLAQTPPPPYTFSGFSDQPRSLHSTSPTLSVHRPATANTEREIFREAMTAYVKGDYVNSADFLEQAAKVEPEAEDVQFYLGVCRLLNGNAEGAIQPLRNVTLTNPSTTTQTYVAKLQQPSHYYLAKAYLQAMKLDDAERELTIASKMAGPLQKDAAQLLGRLKIVRAQ